MNQHLDHLIEDLELEAEQEQAALDLIGAKGLRGPKHMAGRLKRTLQRLASLRGLQVVEAGKSRAREQAMQEIAHKS